MDAQWTPAVGIDGLPGCGRPHLSRLEELKDSKHVYIFFPSLGLTNFGVLGVCNVERSRAIRGSFTFGISDIQRTLSLLACRYDVHALRASIHHYEPKTRMHF